MNGRTSVLVLGTADWNQPIATNQHYAVRELARDFDVTFVESTGLRRPELSRRDLVRMTRRLRGVFSAGENRHSEERRAIPTGARVLSPVVVPWHRAPISWVNRLLIKRLVRGWADQPTRVLWTYTPVTFGLETLAPTVYHCVDLLGAQEKISASVVDNGEKRLARAGAVAGASSSVVAQHLRELGFARVESWPNVADLEVFAEKPGDAARRPSAVFAGNLTESKVDFDLLVALVRSGIELHLAGPVSEGGGDAHRRLLQLENEGAKYHGMLGLEALAALFKTSTVGLIPYVLNEYTRGVNPLKTFEYLAAGLAVVSTPVPAVEGDGRDVLVELDTSRFISSVKRLVGTHAEEDLQRRARKASSHGWLDRGAQMRALVSRVASAE